MRPYRFARTHQRALRLYFARTHERALRLYLARQRERAPRPTVLYQVDGRAPAREQFDATGLARGDRDANPTGISLLALLAEDFATYRRDPLAPGFWAVVVHRLGNWRMGVRTKLLRAPLTLAYRAAFHTVLALWGIDLPYNVKLGRRVRIEHHGCVLMGAREIGDDVVIRHSVTMGLRQRGTRASPKIGNRVEIGPGACILGGIQIGDDCVIGPNTVVANHMRPGSALLGIPPRSVDLAELEAQARAGDPSASRQSGVGESPQGLAVAREPLGAGAAPSARRSRWS